MEYPELFKYKVDRNLHLPTWNLLRTYQWAMEIKSCVVSNWHTIRNGRPIRVSSYDEMCTWSI
jgi:hypothetical protein